MPHHYGSVYQREALLRTIESACYLKLLEHLKPSWPGCPAIYSWPEFATTAVAPATPVDVRNALLTSLLQSNRSQADQRVIAILFLVFWPRLRAIYRRSRTWDTCREDLWQNIVLAFIQAIANPKLTAAADIGKRVYFGTLSGLHSLYRREWARNRRRATVETTRLDRTATHDAGGVFLELRDEIRNGYARLRRQRSLGIIDATEMKLIVGTRLCGRTLGSVAKRRRLSYDAAKCRRDRAEQRLRDRGIMIPRLRVRRHAAPSCFA